MGRSYGDASKGTAVKVGDLVSMNDCCGGPSGSLRCESALVVSVELSHHEAVQVDSQTYHDREVYEFTLMCKCGLFEEYDDRLELILEA